MFSIEDNKLSITRGDTGYLKITIEGYTILEGDVLRLTVSTGIDAKTPLFTKEINAYTTDTFTILPADTTDADYGKYYYDVELDTINNEVFTVIEPTIFKIKGEITQ